MLVKLKLRGLGKVQSIFIAVSESQWGILGKKEEKPAGQVSQNCPSPAPTLAQGLDQIKSKRQTILL